MKKNFFLMAFMAIVLTSCSDDSYTVTGIVNDGTKYVYYTMNFLDTVPTIDSVAVENGHYVIEGKAEQPQLVAGTTDQNVQFWFITEPGKISITAEGIPSGTPQNDSIKSFIDGIKQMQQTDNESFTAYIRQYMKNNPNNLAGAFALYMYTDVLGISEVNDILHACGDVVKDVIYSVIPPSAFNTCEGNMFTDFEVDYNGKVQKLSDYVGKGKYVLVDFWASWCGPCREEIPTIESLYEKYAGEKFDVVGIATWDKVEDTQDAISELGIKYPQILNAQKIGSDAYGINGIPEIILFAPDGTIMQRGLRGQAIVDAVESALK